jgi:prepilin-type N-terminal cleavage/methylation domain-containing protein/prepilin-type processing-associated H-X9-DG protein
MNRVSAIRQSSLTAVAAGGVWARRAGFTLVELLVVIVVIALIAAMLLPALARAKSRALTVSCLNNLKQLQICWFAYAHDNDDVMTPNNFVYYVQVGGTNDASLGEDSLTWCRSIAPEDGYPINENTSLLFRYNQSVGIYHCPADKSMVNGQPGKLRNRSYNMSNSVNCRLDDHFRKLGEVRVPTQLFVFIDTHEDAIWDATFGVLPLGSYWQDYWLDVPADRHQQGANLSFADGHVEHWKWRATKTGIPVGGHNTGPDDLQDLRRVQQHIKGAGGN